MGKKIQFTREASGEVQAREARADPAGEEVQPHGAPVRSPAGSSSATGPHKRQQTWQRAFWKRAPTISKQLNCKLHGRRLPPRFWRLFPPRQDSLCQSVLRFWGLSCRLLPRALTTALVYSEGAGKPAGSQLLTGKQTDVGEVWDDLQSLPSSRNLNW